MQKVEEANLRRNEMIETRIMNLKHETEPHQEEAKLVMSQEEQSRFDKIASMKEKLERARLNRQDILVDKIEKAKICSEPKAGLSTPRSTSASKTVIIHCSDGRYE